MAVPTWQILSQSEILVSTVLVSVIDHFFLDFYARLAFNTNGYAVIFKPFCLFLSDIKFSFLQYYKLTIKYYATQTVNF